MPIPSDPIGREWAETILTSAAQFRRNLVGFLAFDPYGQPQFVGTGFVIGYSEENASALVMTARHVLADGISSIHRPIPRHALSALSFFVADQSANISLDPMKVRAVWMGNETSDMLTMPYVHHAKSLDIAICIVCAQEHASTIFRPEKVNLETSYPSVGESIVVASLSGFVSEELHAGQNEVGQVVKFANRPAVRVGTVTGVYPNGYRHYKWPCFTTSIPVTAGMSGGFVSRSRLGEPFAACGIVSADASSESAHSNASVCGESIIAAVWPSLGYSIPLSNDPSKGTRRLLDMVRTGEVVDSSSNVERILIEESDDGTYKMRFNY